MTFQNAALFVIDVQQGFDNPRWGSRNNPDAEGNIAKLLQIWRERKRPVFHIQHLSQEPQSPLRPGQVGCEFKPLAQPLPDETVVQKDVNSAFIGTDLEHQLRQRSIDTVVIVGLTTNHCVSTTTRMAGNLGFTTYVVSDATASFDLIGHDGKRYAAEEIHAVALANLHREFATVVETQDLIR